MHILRCMGSKFRAKFQKAPLKFHTKFWTHTPQNVHFAVFIFCVWVTISLNFDVISVSETGPRRVIRLRNITTTYHKYIFPHINILYTKSTTPRLQSINSWHRSRTGLLEIYGICAEYDIQMCLAFCVDKNGHGFAIMNNKSAHRPANKKQGLEIRVN